MLSRRSFITGLAGALAAAQAPALILQSRPSLILPNGCPGKVLMPVRSRKSGDFWWLDLPVNVAGGDSIHLTYTVRGPASELWFKGSVVKPVDSPGLVIGVESLRDGLPLGNLIYGNTPEWIAKKTAARSNPTNLEKYRPSEKKWQWMTTSTN